MSMLTNPTLILPGWPAPANVQACVTTRQCPDALTTGRFANGYGDFNLATHVGDEREVVLRNRQRLAALLDKRAEEFAWISQVHGIDVVDAAAAIQSAAAPLQADAVDTETAGLVCTVLTADCLPVLLVDDQGKRVSAVHAGWRGLADGVLEAAAKRFDSGARILAWMGPAIGPSAFEVGEDVFEAFVSVDADAERCFEHSMPGKLWCDMYALARQRLASVGITDVYGGESCTFGETGRFYSFRRDGSASGRMATCIWKTA